MKKYLLMLLATLLILIPSIVNADDDEYERKGTVTEFDGKTISFVTKRGEYFTVPINDETKIEKKTSGEISPGMKIEVEYKKNGQIKEIEIEGRGNDYQTAILTETNSWNVWNRELGNVGDENSPIQKTSIVNVHVNQKPFSIRVIPFDGQLLVPLNEISELLEGQLTYYDAIQVAEIKRNDKELLFKLNKPVAYENLNKVVMPSPLQIQDNDIYIPLSVITNGLGYEISWDESISTIIINEGEKTK